MSEIFPRRAIQPSEVLEPEGLNDDIQPAAAKFARLDQHDFNSNIVGASPQYDSDLYWTFSRSTNTVDPGIGSGTGAGSYRYFPQESSALVKLNSHNWTTINEQQVTTGEAVLWIIATAQYSLKEKSGYFNFLENNEFPSCAEFAVSVDGVVIDGTITGFPSSPTRSFVAYRYKTQRDSSTPAYGPTTPKAQVLAGCGPNMLPVRIMCSVPVPPGTHDVRLIGRRLNIFEEKAVPATGGTDTYVDGLPILIFHNNVMVHAIHTWPGGTRQSASLDVHAIESETDLSNDTMYTRRMAKLAGAGAGYNAILPGNIIRGGLNRYQLPSVIDQVETATINPSPSASSSALWDGWNSLAGWSLVGDGGTNYLKVFSGGVSLTPNDYILVLADLLVEGFDDDGEQNCAAFVIGHNDLGHLHANTESYGYINSYWRTRVSGSVGPTNLYTNVALAAWIDVGMNDTISNIGLYASTWYVGSPATASLVRWLQGRLTAIVFRGVN